MNPAWLDKPTLSGSLVTLRPFAEGDAEALFACIDVEAMRLTGSAHSEEEARAWIARGPAPQMAEWYATRNAQPDRLDLAVVDNVGGQLVGEVVLNDWDEGNHSCNFRIMLGPRARGRGLGTEAAVLVLEHAFTALGLHRVQLEHYAFNPRAGRSYAKAGFVTEGRRRDTLLYDGQWVDAITMAALAPEWRPEGRTGVRPE